MNFGGKFYVRKLSKELKMYHTEGYWGMMGFPMFFGVIVFLVLMYMFIKNVLLDQTNREETALDILKKRLAKGEITIEEFTELKKKIENL